MWGAIDGYTTHLRLAGRSPATIRRRRRSLARFTTVLNNPTISAVTRDDIETWLLGYTSHATRRAYLGDLRGLFTWAVARGHVDHNPTDGIPTPTEPVGAANPLHAHEVAAVLDACNDIDDQRTLRLGLYAGLRVAEIARLEHRDVHLPRRSLTVRHGKGGKTRTLPVAPELAEVLDPGTDAPVVNARTGAGVSQRVNRIYDRAGVVGHRAHDLRATFATAVHDRTGDIYLVSRLLGHSSVQTTQRYLLSRPGDVEAVSGLFAA